MPTETIAVLSDIAGLAEIPHGASENKASPTGYTLGPGIPGQPWLVDVAEVSGGRARFGFPLIKMIWWYQGGEFPASEATRLADSVKKGGRWVVVVAVQTKGSPYFGLYVVPKEFAGAVQNYGSGLAAAVMQARSAGETLVKVGGEVVKTAAETLRDTLSLGAKIGKWVAIGAGIVLLILVVPKILPRKNPARRRLDYYRGRR